MDSQNTLMLARKDRLVSAKITIRPFAQEDAARVRALFIAVNRLLSPPDLRDAFEAYIERALREEIDRILAYYGERDGGFWVAVKDDKVVGTFGLELTSVAAHVCRSFGATTGHCSADAPIRGKRMLPSKSQTLELSTAQIQHAAIALYKNAGFRLVRQETAEAVSNKTVGSGIRRYYFEKVLWDGDP
jgi:hypothetical protein